MATALDIKNKQAVQDYITSQYQTAFDRPAVFDESIQGDADYWTDQIQSGALKAGDLMGHLKASQEFTNDIKNDPGGVDHTKSIQDQFNNNQWLQHFGPGGTYESSNPIGQATTQIQGISNTLAQNMPNNTTMGGGGSEEYIDRVYNAANIPSNTDDGNVTITPTGPNNYLTMDDLTKFFADRDAAASDKKSEGGMGDFMKFMMFMSMMRPQGGGFGGSQYGYGGLNPGGVMAASNPMDNFQSYMDNFKSLNSSLLN
tara:strand:- start:45 stop:815 length:771 start_codon:yes stop_codon:yes gene_type:complete